MGMTRATGGPVRCPWCARPVSDGPGSPEACPSCGVPLSPAVVGSRPDRPGTGVRAQRARKSQRLRAVATVLALTAVMLIISAIGVAAALLRADGSDIEAQNSLETTLKAAEAIRADGTDFSQVRPETLGAHVPGVSVVASTVNSRSPATVSMVTTSGATSTTAGWFGAARAKSGRCYVAGVVNLDPKELRSILPPSVNCTGDAARAVLTPLASDTPAMVPTPATGAGAGATG